MKRVNSSSIMEWKVYSLKKRKRKKIYKFAETKTLQFYDNHILF